MTGLATSVQQAVYTALANNAALDALLARFYATETSAYLAGTPAVYDDVPQISDTGDDTFFPYVTVGEDTVTDWSTDTASGGEATITIHVWSRQNGRKETKAVQEAIYNALHRQDLTTPGFEFIGCEFEFAETMRDADGQTYHGVQRFRLLLDEAGYGE